MICMVPMVALWGTKSCVRLRGTACAHDFRCFFVDEFAFGCIYVACPSHVHLRLVRLRSSSTMAVRCRCCHLATWDSHRLGLFHAEAWGSILSPFQSMEPKFPLEPVRTVFCFDWGSNVSDWNQSRMKRENPTRKGRRLQPFVFDVICKCAVRCLHHGRVATSQGAAGQTPSARSSRTKESAGEESESEWKSRRRIQPTRTKTKRTTRVGEENQARAKGYDGTETCNDASKTHGTNDETNAHVDPIRYEKVGVAWEDTDWERIHE